MASLENTWRIETQEKSLAITDEELAVKKRTDDLKKLLEEEKLK